MGLTPIESKEFKEGIDASYDVRGVETSKGRDKKSVILNVN